jgi:hypothetical protein
VYQQHFQLSWSGPEVDSAFEMITDQAAGSHVQVLSTEAQSYLARHEQLVQAVLHASGRIGLSDQVTAANPGHTC